MKNSLGSMGQVILGFRSLIIKLALFVLFAALLAWALGGTLFPRPEVVEFDSILFQNHRWYWRMSAGGKEPGKGRMIWQLIRSQPDGEMPEIVDGQAWADGTGPVVIGDSLYFAGLSSLNPNEHWRILRVDGSLEPMEEHLMPDRLEVERQLTRLMKGLEIQTLEAIEAERERVLEPPAVSAD